MAITLVCHRLMPLLMKELGRGHNYTPRKTIILRFRHDGQDQIRYSLSFLPYTITSTAPVAINPAIIVPMFNRPYLENHTTE